MNLANEGLEARKKEEEVAARKRKAEDEATWEGQRKRYIVRNCTDICAYSWPRGACGQLEELCHPEQEEKEAEGRCSRLSRTLLSSPHMRCPPFTHITTGMSIEILYSYVITHSDTKESNNIM